MTAELARDEIQSTSWPHIKKLDRTQLLVCHQLRVRTVYHSMHGAEMECTTEPTLSCCTKRSCISQSGDFVTCEMFIDGAVNKACAWFEILRVISNKWSTWIIMVHYIAHNTNKCCRGRCPCFERSSLMNCAQDSGFESRPCQSLQVLCYLKG